MSRGWLRWSTTRSTSRFSSPTIEQWTEPGEPQFGPGRLPRGPEEIIQATKGGIWTFQALFVAPSDQNDEVRIGLLVCDHVRPEFLGISGDYEDMFCRLFADHNEVQVVAYEAVNGELPADPSEADAWLTTGSRHSVNDDEPWIRDLEAFVRKVAGAGAPFVGICFGHQLIAKALGGSVVKSERGWGVGVQEVEVNEELGWGGSYRVLTSYQDQVATLPPGGEILGWNEHCPVSVMGVGSSILGIQGHPEFEPAYSKALMQSRRGQVIPEETVDAGLASLAEQPDGSRLADWILGFIEKARQASAR